MPFSLRLDAKTTARIRRLTEATGQSKSAVVREAIARYSAEAETTEREDESAYARLKPFIGSISTDGADYSKDTHTKYGRKVRQAHRARRPR